MYMWVEVIGLAGSINLGLAEVRAPFYLWLMILRDHFSQRMPRLGLISSFMITGYDHDDLDDHDDKDDKDEEDDDKWDR